MIVSTEYKQIASDVAKDLLIKLIDNGTISFAVIRKAKAEYNREVIKQTSELFSYFYEEIYKILSD